MCGIVGLVDFPKRLTALEPLLQEMSSSLAHRGPDAQGCWIDEQASIGLGHRRLSILDLSDEGAQPMISSTGRYVIVYNGEVYNFQTIRKDLEPLGYNFRGHSDTEVMLAAIEEWGLLNALEHFIGMFAFALWDKKTHTLSLVRDRVGIKPLYYGVVNGIFVFASELKALRLIPGATAEVDRQALASMMRYCFIPAPNTIFTQIKKLPAGTVLSLKGDASQAGFSIKPYWSGKKVVEQAIANPFTGTFSEAVSELDRLLHDAIRLRMLSDVPLGAFLSGGIDSSTVVAIMQAQSAQAVKTFTIGFHEHKHNEAPSAKAVAQYLGTDHTELYVSSAEAMSVIPHLATLYDEPFADSSQIPTFLVSELTRKHVTVSLSGDGGDELFYGYRRYFEAQKRWSQIGWLPYSIRIALRNLLFRTVPKHWSKPNTLAEMLGSRNADDLYKWLLSNWKDPGAIVLGTGGRETIFENIEETASLLSFAQRVMFYDMSLYLPDDILVKVDRASMAVGLEARVPLLDHRIVEFAWCLPLEYKLHNGQGKRILKKVLNRYVPPSLAERPKKGFGVPISEWLKGPLRDWAEALLDKQRLTNEGYLAAPFIHRKWQEHLAGERDWHYELWNVLMFQAWLETA